MSSLLTLLYDRQAVQRATEWRNSIASAAISVVNSLFDYLDLTRTSTEAQQEMAAELLANLGYAFLEMEDIFKNGKKEVYGKI